MCDRTEALTILEKVVKGCSEIIPVSDAYLYGSYARGDHDEESDVDIFLTTPLTMPEIEKKRWDISGIASDLSLEHDVVVSVCVRPQVAFQPEHHPYYEDIVREGSNTGNKLYDVSRRRHDLYLRLFSFLSKLHDSEV